MLGGIKMKHPLETSLKKMVREAFEGPPIPVKESWFTNTEPNSGIFGALEKLTANEASISVHGATLAAHADHLRYHMWGTNELLEKGNFPKMDWEESWKINFVDEQQWHRIREGLRCEYLRLLENLEAIDWNEIIANEVTGSLAHSAYHLGAILQILKAIRDI
jgi:hypothetical protein